MIRLNSIMTGVKILKIETSKLDFYFNIMLEVVNVVYKTRVPYNLNLDHLSKIIENSYLYVGRPTQLKINYPNDKIVCLLFGKGGLRIMGKGASTQQNVDQVLRNVLEIISPTNLAPSQSRLVLQTMTVVADLPGSVDLYKFAESCAAGGMKPVYDFELFSALKLDSFRPICVNVFSSGKVIMCGIKDLKCADNILTDVLDIYNKL